MSLRDHLGTLRLLRTRSLPEPELQQLRIARLRKLVAHAYRSVPLYEDLFKRCGIDPCGIGSFSDLNRLPVLDRESLQSVPLSDRLSRGIDPEDCLVRHTGGSCGKPLAFLGLASELDFEAMGWLRTWRRLGLSWRHHHATVKYPDDILIDRSNKWYQRLGFLRVSYLDLRRPIPALLEELRSLQPEVLRAPPSVLIALAREIRNGSPSQKARPRLVFSTSEKLPRSAARYVAETLACEVHDCYGATEAGCIAWRCPLCDRFHLNSDYLHLEVLKDGRPAAAGEVGEVVVTNLFRFAMPIIRLSLGDLCEVAETGDCTASSYPLSVSRILGRTIDSFELPDGTEFSPYSLMPDDLPGILAYKIVQEAPGRVRIFVVPGEELTEESLEQERIGYEKLLPGELEVSFSLVEQLPMIHDWSTRHRQAARWQRQPSPDP